MNRLKKIIIVIVCSICMLGNAIFRPVPVDAVVAETAVAALASEGLLELILSIGATVMTVEGFNAIKDDVVEYYNSAEERAEDEDDPAVERWKKLKEKKKDVVVDYDRFLESRFPDNNNKPPSIISTGIAISSAAILYAEWFYKYYFQEKVEPPREEELDRWLQLQDDNYPVLSRIKIVESLPKSCSDLANHWSTGTDYGIYFIGYNPAYASSSGLDYSRYYLRPNSDSWLNLSLTDSITNSSDIGWKQFGQIDISANVCDSAYAIYRDDRITSNNGEICYDNAYSNGSYNYCPMYALDSAGSYNGESWDGAQIIMQMNGHPFWVFMWNKDGVKTQIRWTGEQFQYLNNDPYIYTKDGYYRSLTDLYNIKETDIIESVCTKLQDMLEAYNSALPDEIPYIDYSHLEVLQSDIQEAVNAEVGDEYPQRKNIVPDFPSTYPDEFPDIFKKAIDASKTDSEPDPNPNPDPEPDPNPNPEPDPNPNPDPGPDPNPDSDSNGGSPSKDDYSLDLMDFFPFCLPNDLYLIVSALAAEPEAPKFKWNVPTIGKKVENHYVEVDLSVWNKAAELFRGMQDILLIYLLLNACKKLVKGG